MSKKRRGQGQAKDGNFASAGSRFQRRAARRLDERIGNGKLWDRSMGYTRPGSEDGHA